MKFLAVTLFAVGLSQASLAVDINAQVSLHGRAVNLTKSEQRIQWYDLKDAKYNAKGFTQWKPTPEGFLLKNTVDKFQVACLANVGKATDNGNKMSMSFKCSDPMPQDVIDVMKSDSKKTAFLQQGAKFTPLMEKNLLPLDPKLLYEHEQESGRQASSGTWSRDQDIDDRVNEGESNNADLDIEAESELDQKMEQRYLDHVDVGPGNALDEENERDTQHPPQFYKKSTRKKIVHKHSGLIDVPYVDAGIDRIVNEKMFQFFKKHPQYHTPKAYWLTAQRWRKWMRMSGDESDEAGLYGNHGAGTGNGEGGEGMFHGDGGMGGEGGPDGDEGPNGMWKRCPENVPKRWPDTPRVQCKHYAVSPMGYWGCDWLFEDGTCGNTEFFPTIRWDGLDAYVMPKPDKDAEPGEQWHSDKYYQNEILPGGNPVNHDYYTL
jgi:hypothetical protein